MNETAILAVKCAALIGIVLIHTALLSWRYSRKDRHLKKSIRSLESTVSFLQFLNELPLGLPQSDLQTSIWNRLQEVLRPMNIHSRLWVVESSWKTLQGMGDLTGKGPVRQHLPMSACPALTGRHPYNYSRTHQNPCPSEQFSYGKHLCLPLLDGRDSFGVLFLSTEKEDAWDPQDLNVFEMLAQAIALSFQRRSMFDKLQEKISELHFSFEVGASALTTFGGSTESLEETTLHTLDAVLSVLKVDRASFMEWDPEKHTLTTRWFRGDGRKLETPLILQEGEGMAGWALKSGQPYWAEYAMGDPHYIATQGSVCSLLSVPIFSPNGTPMGVINSVTLTRARRFAPREVQFLANFGRLAALAMENAQLHQQSRHSISHLNEVSRLKSHFFSLVSHDLRGPLTGIRGFSEVLKQQTLGKLTPAQMEMLEQMEHQVELQERMVDDLLDYARMEQGKLTINKSTTSLETLIKEEIEKSQHQARERGITLRGPVMKTHHPLALPVDSGRIRQVFWNLIFNALKFTPEGGDVEVRVDAQGAFAVFEIVDTGVGLSGETQDKIFETFFQITPGGSKGSSGLGLGLAICKEIVQAHGGIISAHSPGLGKGTTMRFTLPLKEPLSEKLAA